MSFHCSECGKVLVQVAGDMCGPCRKEKAAQARQKSMEMHKDAPKNKVSPKEECKGDLIIEITRKDKKEFSDRVDIKVKSPKGSKTAKTRKTKVIEKNIEKHIEKYKFVGLEPAEYTVSITPQKDEKDWRIISAKPESDDINVRVGKGGVAEAKFILAPFYKYIRFIGYELPTGYGGKKPPYYLGNKDVEKDISKRCDIMKNAIKTAYEMVSGIEADKNDPMILKVFMAPEFYFRGAEGGYPVGKISMIMENLQKEALSDERDYSDWLFIFGTSIGYLKHEGSKSRVGKVEKDLTGMTILTIEPVSRGVEINSTIRQTQGPSVGKVTSSHGVLYKDDTGKEKSGFRLTLDTNAEFKTGDLVDLIRPEGETEIFNIALVRKGGKENSISSIGTKGLRRALIYKEYISSIDFWSKDFNKNSFHKKREIDIHDDSDRKVLPTEGSQYYGSFKVNRAGDTYKWTGKKPGDDQVREHTERISEVNKSGIGGGSVFTIDDITFGLEVCLDHAQERLKEYYDNFAAAGEPKVQIQLIPSAGMKIETNSICCVNNGLVFNVDGLRNDGDSKAIVNTGGAGTGIGNRSTKNLKLSGKDWWTITHKNYFKQHGLIRVYNEEKIPDKANV